MSDFKTPTFPVKGKPDTLSAQPINELIVLKHEQKDVQYTDSSTNGKYCKNCTKWNPPCNCYGVNGMIKPEGYCTKYELVKMIGMPLGE